MQFKTTPDTLLEAGDKKGERQSTWRAAADMSVTTAPQLSDLTSSAYTHQNNFIIHLLSQKMLSKSWP